MKNLRNKGMFVMVAKWIGGFGTMLGIGTGLIYGKDRFNQFKEDIEINKIDIDSVSQEEVDLYREHNDGAKYLSNKDIKEGLAKLKRKNRVREEKFRRYKKIVKETKD